MLKQRLVASLIIRHGQVVQSLGFKHTNIIHNKPSIAVDFFDKWSADEIVVLDVSPDTSRRDSFLNTLRELAAKCFVPLTVGGWIASEEDMRGMLRLGADKVTINTEAFRQPDLIARCSRVFGSQCVVVSIDARSDGNGGYEVFVNRGRDATGMTPVEWARKAQDQGAGEIYLTSIDHDGSRNGLDVGLMRQVAEAVDIPLIAFGGASTWEHLRQALVEGGADAVAAANMFHYTEHSMRKAKQYLREHGLNVR